jgi:uncharacterized protein (UPF0276 family)
MHGFGLRVPHYAELLERRPRGDFFEAISENFMGRGGRARAVLERVRRDADIALHGVSLSLGGTDPLNDAYLDALVELERRYAPRFVSDHLCFGTFGGHYGHDLWPLPHSEEAIEHIATRIAHVQDRLRRQILIENVSSYVEYQASEMPEWTFLTAVAERADCLILLDVNNVVVNAKNHGFDANEYIAALPVPRVAQLHLAGHSDYGTHAIDDHGSAVPDEVWGLYDRVVARFGSVPAIVEWDDNVPTLDELQAQSEQARVREHAALEHRASCAAGFDTGASA